MLCSLNLSKSLESEWSNFDSTKLISYTKLHPNKEC